MLTVKTLITFLLGLVCGAVLSPIAVIIYLMKTSLKQEGTWSRDL
jgi:biotin transporter BioY